jgi:hypothetical protein
MTPETNQEQEMQREALRKEFISQLVRQLAGMGIPTQYRGMHESEVNERTISFEPNPVSENGDILYHDSLDVNPNHFHAVPVMRLVKLPGIYKIAIDIIQKLPGDESLKAELKSGLFESTEP